MYKVPCAGGADAGVGPTDGAVVDDVTGRGGARGLLLRGVTGGVTGLHCARADSLGRTAMPIQ
jgi:hypothetical protein